MQSKDFPEANVTLAKTQPQFRALRAAITLLNPDGWPPVYNYQICFELDETEIAQVVATGQIWFGQTGNIFHPVLLRTDNPYRSLLVTWRRFGDGIRFTYGLGDNGPENGGTPVEAKRASAAEFITSMRDWYNVDPSEIMFVAEPETAVDADGNIIDL